MTVDRAARPFIAIFGTILHPEREEVRRYDEDRQVSILVAEPLSAGTVAVVESGTRMTKVARETTDDD